MRVRVFLVMVLAFGVVAPGAAQVVDETQLFPVVAHTEGAGDPPTSWRSDLTVHNVMDVGLTVGVMFLPFNRANDAEEGDMEELILDPRETLTIEDVIVDLFGITENTSGALLLMCDAETFPSNPDDAAMLATTRTYTVGSAVGTFGTAVQAVPFSGRILNAGQSISLITGARNDSDYRSNLGIVNISFSGLPITVHYRFLNMDGSEIATGSKDLDEYSGGQWSFRSLGVPRVIEGPLTVELWLDPDDIAGDPCVLDEDDLNLFVAYATKVDGNPTGSGDGEFIYAASLEDVECDK
jgi:hypothetical protein